MKLSERKEIMASAAYRPGALFDFVRKRLNAKNDRRLAMKLGFTASELCRMRHQVQIISDSMLISMHEKTGMGTLELKKIAGMV